MPLEFYESLPDFLQKIYSLKRPYPADDIQAVIDRKDEAIPHLIKALERSLLEDPDELFEDDYMLHFYAFYLLGHFKETSARTVLSKIAHSQEAEDEFDDIISEGFDKILAACFFDSPLELYALVDDDGVTEYSRSAALGAIGILHHHKQISRDILTSYLDSLYTSTLKDAPEVLRNTAIQLSTSFLIEEHIPHIKDQYEIGFPFMPFYSQEQIEEAFQKKDPIDSPDNTFRLLKHPHEELSTWHCFTEASAKKEKEFYDEIFKDTDLDEDKDLEEDNFDEEPLPTFSTPTETSNQPFIRDTPKVGRNDPCPCGSGKKYKKCCDK
tara:strand:+ start:892 stop:1866 length:975 start_codon:yes stop_codon:yes gene_type:complete